VFGRYKRAVGNIDGCELLLPAPSRGRLSGTYTCPTNDDADETIVTGLPTAGSFAGSTGTRVYTYRLGKRPVTTGPAPCSPNPIPVAANCYNCRRSSCTGPGGCTVCWSGTRRPRSAGTRSGLPRPSCRPLGCCRPCLKRQKTIGPAVK